MKPCRKLRNEIETEQIYTGYRCTVMQNMYMCQKKQNDLILYRFIVNYSYSFTLFYPILPFDRTLDNAICMTLA